MKTARLAILGAAVATLAGCETIPVLDQANYYPAARYHPEPLLHEKEFWDLSLKEAKD